MRILVISQYPICPAIHGGQKRTAAIVSFYRKNHVVKHVAIYWPDIYKTQRKSQDSEHIVISDKYLIDQLRAHPERSDLLLGRSLSIKSRHANKLMGIISLYNPDVIHVEQPYLIPSVTAILTRMKRRPVIVHGSQNVEYILKNNIYSQSLPRRDLSYLVKNTETIEDIAIEQSDINVGVSRVDIKLFRRRKKSLWVLAGNGTNQISKTPHYPEKTRQDSNIIFIGSDHPPNYMGIESLLKDTRFMKEKGTLLLIGGVANYFRREYPEDDLFWVGKKAIGQIDENELQKYIQQADIIVLPVNNGGGSNLKTAEAIAAHKKIVGTSFAFRGYERYKLLPNVFIANTTDDFKAKLLEAIAAVDEPYTNQQIRLIEDLSWERTLHALSTVPRYARLLLFIDSVKSAISRKLFRNRT